MSLTYFQMTEIGRWRVKMKREHVVFLNLPEQVWIVLADKADLLGGDVGDVLSDLVEKMIVQESPVLSDGSSIDSGVTAERVQQIQKGMDKNELVAAFIRENSDERRLYMKSEGKTIATYSHMIVASSRGQRLVWDVRGSFGDVVEMMRRFIVDCPTALAAFKEFMNRR